MIMVCKSMHICGDIYSPSRGQPHPKYKANFNRATTAKGAHRGQQTAEEHAHTHRQSGEVHTVNEVSGNKLSP